MALLDGLAKCTILSKLGNGQAVSNTFHISKSGAGSPPDLTELTDLAVQIGTWFGTSYEAALLAADTLYSVTTYQVTDPVAIVPIEESVNVIAHVGTNGSSGRTAPASTCPVLSLHTAVASRRARGHLFLPPTIAGSDFTTANAYSTGSSNWSNYTALQGKYAAGCGLSPTWTGAELSQWTLCIFSKKAASVGDPSITYCTTASLSTQVHWLRSREKGSS